MTNYSNIKTKLACALIALGMGISLAFAQEETQEQPGPELVLNVKPGLCLRYSSGEECQLSVEIIWQDSEPGDFCLHSIQDSEPVQCWNNIEGASLEEERHIDADLIYWLSHPGQDIQLVTARVEMATIVEDDKRSRSRRRHIWNLI